MIKSKLKFLPPPQSLLTLLYYVYFTLLSQSIGHQVFLLYSIAETMTARSPSSMFCCCTIIVQGREDFCSSSTANSVPKLPVSDTIFTTESGLEGCGLGAACVHTKKFLSLHHTHVKVQSSEKEGKSSQYTL